MVSFDEIDLIARLAGLSGRLRLTFAAACATRMARACRAGQDHLGLRAPQLVSHTLDRIWEFAMGGPADDWARAERDLAALITDEDDLGGPQHYMVDDALAATVYAVRTAATGDPRHAALSARRAYETVDQFAQRRLTATSFDASVERALLADAAVQTELSRQARDLAGLERVGAQNPSAEIKAVQEPVAAEELIPLGDLHGSLSGAG